MCIPQAADFQRLTANDCAVVSFGLGKCLYAGWGGLLLTQNSEQASRVRELSRRMVAEDSLSNRCRHAFEVLARTTAHLRILYGLGRKLADWRNRPSTRSPVVQQPAPEEMPQQPMIDPDRSRGQGRSREWREPMTTLNRKLARRNLIVAEEAIDLRRRQAEIYRRILEPSKTLFVAGSESLPQSHFPIGIASGMRSEFRRLLASEGIDTGTYFPFPRSLQRSIYPNASRAADEVVLLPLGPCVSQREVEVIAKRALKISGQILKQGVP
jgi:dTDP-4-amino-4,6-dideoxygalactose transaminase